MRTRDGVRLDADVYRPSAAGEFPVLLMRQPYGRAIASTVVYAHPAWYAAQGYIVVIQDVRGRGTSEGTFRLFADETADGYDTVNWAAALPGSTGQVGMYGFSYQGMTQLYAAIARPPALKTLCPAMIGYDLYQDWAYENGAFCLQANLGWAIQLAAETARLQGNEDAFRTLGSAAKNLPLSDPVPTRSGILKHFDPESFYHDWLDHPEPDAYWEALSPSHHLSQVDLPMLHIGGWYDTFLRGTLRLYREMASRSAHPQHLIVGPWAHLPWGRKVGAIDLGSAAVSPCDRLQLRWFDYFLKGIDNGLMNEAPIRLFELGSNQWRSFNQLPTPEPEPFYLQSTGLASIDENDGKLTPSATAEAQLPDRLVHDPWRPVPSLGGHAAIPAGMFDRASIDCRSDVLTYTTAPLLKDLSLVGEAAAELFAIADTPSFDLSVVLSEVLPNGSVFNLAQGHITVKPGQALPIRVPLQAVCARVQAGHGLRLSISAACFPAYPVNGGQGNPGEARLIDQAIITVTLQLGGETASRIQLPVESEPPWQERSVFI